MAAVCAVFVLPMTQIRVYTAHVALLFLLKNADVTLQDAGQCVSGGFTWQERCSLNLAAGRGGGRQPQLVGLHSLIPFAGSGVS